MASKALVLLGLFAFLLVVSEVAAASDTVDSGSEEPVQLDLYGLIGNEGGSEGQGKICRCRPGLRCCRCIGGRCVRCRPSCRDAGEAVQTQPDTVDSGSEESVQLDQYGHDSNEGYNERGSEGQGKICRCRPGLRCCRCIGGRCVRCRPSCRDAGEAVQTQPDTVDSGNEKSVQLDQYGHEGNEGYSEGGSEGQGKICRCRPGLRCCRCIGGRCVRCRPSCRDAGEPVQTQPDTVDSGCVESVQLDQYGHDGNEGYNEGGSEGQRKICRCRPGLRCCRCIGGRCVRCRPSCRDAGEAVQTQPDTVDSGSEESVQLDQYGHDGNEGTTKKEAARDKEKYVAADLASAAAAVLVAAA